MWLVHVLSPHVHGSWPTRKRSHPPPQLPQLSLLPPLSVSSPIRSLMSSSNCQFPKAARSATEIILGQLSCKAAKEHPPKLLTISAAPSLHFSVTPRKTTGGQLCHGQGVLESAAGEQQVRKGKALDPGWHKPQPHQQPPAYIPVLMPQVLSWATGCFPDIQTPTACG